MEILDQLIEVRAKIEKFSGYSAHADQFYLMDWIKNFQKPGLTSAVGQAHELKKVFVVQGEPLPAATLASLIKDELGIDSKVPKIGEIIELD